MAQLTLTVKMVGEPPKDYTITPKTEVAFEREKQRPLPEGITYFEGLYYLAWLQKHANGEVVTPFDEWMGQLEECNVKATVPKDSAQPVSDSPDSPASPA